MIDSADVPQADNLRAVRLVVRALSQGFREASSIAREAGIQPRHVAYAQNAARVLGLVDARGGLTLRGASLLATVEHSEAERALLTQAYAESPALARLCPGLLSPEAPSRDALTQRLIDVAGLSRSTAERRAQTLLSWRAQLVPSTPSLFSDG